MADRTDPAATPTSGSFDCRRCGACCASYRVSFYWAEAEVLALPDELVEQITPWHACLAGTQSAQPRCRALHGEIGSRACCTIYPQRPSPCHEVQVGDDRCQRARRGHGLPPLAEIR
ncbi:YkgJ family cysteine cluster protein [Accumulibacter sp.]|uniref:YkgJ family cysteine cluster protein n=1 Tax=Accumulibacter sp. TaxID=2053492 RepID=UPI0025DE6C5F|nr:YkgJ family cysteine cluster protein [Accumulibacter sp.]MCM8614177.1 YkgJ family cysteine cluster protein [Accumulibacter sp.]MCM8637944.1 YkgJ family cysteine cluster protein [Accumulibacter sp.]MCM8641413.1 YkgJ family cysteine cluster protein [Accumulibacter sp.]